MRVNKRRTLILATVSIIVLCWYAVQFEGDPKPVDPILVASIHEMPAWRGQPALLQNVDEPAAIYIVSGGPGSDGLFEAFRLDVNSGTRSSVRIRFGPDSAYIAFDSAEVTDIPAIEFRGVRLQRPTLHLFKFPGPGGPGLHLVDSATGVMHVVAKTGNTRQLLLTRTVINSSRMPEMASLLWVNRSRKLAAFLWQEADMGTLYVFSLDSNRFPGKDPAGAG